MIIDQSINYILTHIDECFKRINVEKLDDMLETILGADKVFVYGAGRSGLIIRAFATRLGHLGIRTYVIGETITPIVQRDDCVILISGSGETASVVKTASIVKKIGAHLMVITGSKNSSLASIGKTVVLPSSNFDDYKKRLAPLGTLFEDSALIFLDAIIAELMERKGESEEKMSARHATLE